MARGGYLDSNKDDSRDRKDKEEETDDDKIDLSFEDGIKGKLTMQGFVQKWFVDKGFGVINVKGHSVFCHMDRFVGQQWLRVGGDVWVKVVEDPSKGDGLSKIAETWESSRWDKERARRKAQSAVDVAAKA